MYCSEEASMTEPNSQSDISETDRVFAKRAKELANTAAMALEEAYSYVNGIKNKYLREITEKEVDKIVEFL